MYSFATTSKSLRVYHDMYCIVCTSSTGDPRSRRSAPGISGRARPQAWRRLRSGISSATSQRWRWRRRANHLMGVKKRHATAQLRPVAATTAADSEGARGTWARERARSSFPLRPQQRGYWGRIRCGGSAYTCGPTTSSSRGTPRLHFVNSIFSAGEPPERLCARVELNGGNMYNNPAS